jgi:hypothetical protein
MKRERGSRLDIGDVEKGKRRHIPECGEQGEREKGEKENRRKGGGQMDYGERMEILRGFQSQDPFFEFNDWLYNAR